MLFYRVCHRSLKTHRGMFTFNSGPYTLDHKNGVDDGVLDGLYEMASKHARDRNTPSVPIDFHYNYPFDGEFVCGFNSPERLERWFKGYFELLYEADFMVRVWDIPRSLVELGNKQDCAFMDYVACIAPVKEMDMAEFEKSLGKVLV